MILRPFTALLLLLATMPFASAQRVVHYKNTQIFDGKEFVQREFWTVDNTITFKAPLGAKGTDYDAEGRFVVPAYGDAVAMGYCDFNDAEYYLKQYQQEGIQFLYALGHSAAFEEKARGIVSDKTAEVRFGNGILTPPGGSPSHLWNEMVEKRKQNSTLDNVKGPMGAGDNYWIVGGKDAFLIDWPKILLQRPDVICMMMPDAASVSDKKAMMDEKTMKAVAKACKKEKLKLILVTRSKADFLQAVALKPHIIAGVPFVEGLSEKEVKTLVKSKAFVAPCFFSSMRELSINPVALAAAGSPSQSKIVEMQAAIFKQLLAAKVPMVLGSADPSRGTMPEVNQWVQFGITDHVTLLKIMCENTPMAINPNRKVGKIAEGYEANFLIINANPSDNIQKSRLISKAVKNGYLLETPSFKSSF
jgi:hypothetical protein